MVGHGDDTPIIQRDRPVVGDALQEGRPGRPGDCGTIVRDGQDIDVLAILRQDVDTFPSSFGGQVDARPRSDAAAATEVQPDIPGPEGCPLFGTAPRAGPTASGAIPVRGHVPRGAALGTAAIAVLPVRDQPQIPGVQALFGDPLERGRHLGQGGH